MKPKTARLWLFVVLLLLAALGSHNIPLAAGVEQVGTYTFEAYCVGDDLHIDNPTTYLSYNWRVNGNGPNLPTAGYPLPHEFVISGPGTWSGLVFEDDGCGGTWYASSFMFIEPKTITCGPGCDLLLNVPETAVGGTFVTDAPIFWAPDSSATTEYVITAGNSALVIGVDASGQFRKIVWGCDLLWVPAGALGPNYDAVWNGAPLPADVVD